MSRFGFVGGSYTLSSPHADIQAAINLYPESIESQEGKSPLLQLYTPGALTFCVGPGGTGRGIFTFLGRTFGVSGTTFFEALVNGTQANTNTVANDGSPVSWAANASGQLLIASGGIAYLFNMNGNTFAPVAALQGISILQVCYSDAFFLALQANSNIFYISALEDGTTWDLGNASALSVFAENIQAMIADHREPYFFGQKKSQVYYDSGAANTPYVPINGAYIEEAVASPFSVVQMDNSIFWLGANVDRGQGIVWRLNGYIPTRISTHAIEFAIQNYPTISDAIAYSYQEYGHTFYILYFPTANVTWGYDVASGFWHQRGYYSQGAYSAHRSMAHTFNFGMHLVMDPVTGNINQQSSSLLTEADGTLIRRLRRAPHISTEQEWIFHQSLQVDVETGLGTFSGGTTFPGAIVMKDSTGQLWSVTVTDIGTLIQSKISAGPQPNVIQLNDANGNSWQIGINPSGMLTASTITQGSYPPSFLVASVTGQKVWFLEVALPGNPQTQTAGAIMRGPQMSLRWSDDGGHNWSNYYIVDCGQLGMYKARAIWRRLGRSRDRVYEITMSDPIPWRIVDAYLKATPDFGPQKRIVKKLAEVA